MEDIKYVKMHRNSLPWAGQTEWFGCTENLTKGMAVNEYLNFTMRRKSAVEKTTEAYKRLEKAHTNAQNKVESNKTVAHNIEMHKREILYLTQEIEKVIHTQELISKSAAKIQKVARGYLIRKGLETEIMAIRKRSVKTWVQNLKKSDDYYIYELGPKPQQAARMIQRFAKRLLFKFKIRRLLRIYNIIRAQKVEEINDVIRVAVRTMQAKLIISNIKFEIYKAGRLKKIREKLSILSVKNFWRKSRFTFKIIMQKTKKYKRMILNQQRMKKQSNANLLAGKKGEGNKGEFLAVNDGIRNSSSRSSFADDMDSEDGDEEAEENKDVDSQTSEINRKIEQERRERIATSKLAYSISKNKEPLNLLPYLYQKDILEGVSPPSHHISATRATVFRMNNSNPKRHSPSKSKPEIEEQRLTFTKPNTAPSPRKKMGTDGNPLYMKPTTASKMCRWDAEPPFDEIEDPKKNIKPREDSKVLSNTYTYIQKVSKAYTRIEKFDKPVWRPNTNYKQAYITNLGNTSFVKTPKVKVRPSTMSVSPRTQIARREYSVVSPVIETKIEVNSLSFEAALPGLANMLQSYGNGFVVRVRPGTDRLKRLSSLK